MDPSVTSIPAWAVEKLHKELDGEEKHLGDPIFWGQPCQDEEAHRKYWDRFYKTKGMCKTCNFCEGEGAVFCWVVCCPFATCWAVDACCGDENKTQVKKRVPAYMKMVWILYRDHIVNIGVTRMIIFHLANIDSVEDSDSYDRDMRYGLYACAQDYCTGSKMEGIIVRGCNNEYDGDIVSLPYYPRMMEHPQKFAAAANSQIKDCKDTRKILKEASPNKLVKDFAARRRLERGQARNVKVDETCPLCGEKTGTGPFCRGCGRDRDLIVHIDCTKCGVPQNGGEFCALCGTPCTPPITGEAKIVEQSVKPVTTNSMEANSANGMSLR